MLPTEKRNNYNLKSEGNFLKIFPYYIGIYDQKSDFDQELNELVDF